MAKEKKKLEIQGIELAPEGAIGPFFLKVLKGGRVVDLQNPSKGQHIVYYTESVDFYNQDKWYYFTLMNKDHVKKAMCDYETHCGYDRGPRYDRVVRRLWYGTFSSDS